MKLFFQFLSFILIVFFAIGNSYAQRYWVAAGPATWSSNNWSNTSGGAPDGGGPPTAGVDAVFNANGAGNCTIDVAVGFDGINTSGYSGIIDLNGQTFNISGANNCIFAAGTLNDSPGTSKIQINTTGVVRFSGANFGAAIDATGSIDFDGGIFSAPVIAEHNGAQTNGNGGCTFNSTLDVLNSGASEIRMSNSVPDIFNGNVSLDNTGSSVLRIGFNAAGTQFNGNITVDCTNGTGIYIGDGGSASVSFSAGTVLSIGTAFNAGTLRLEHITQLGADNLNLDLTGTSSIYLEGCTFLGDIDFKAPRLTTTTSTFSGITILEKKDGGNDQSAGGNTYNNDLTIIHNGIDQFLHGNTSPDIFNGNVLVQNLSAGIVYLAHNSIGNTFNGNVEVENTTGGGVRFGQGGGASVTLATGNTLTAGGVGFVNGDLRISNFSQLGGTAQNITIDPTSSIRINQSNWSGNIIITGGFIETDNTMYSGTTTISQNGAIGNASSGGNTFVADAVLNNTSNTRLQFGDTNPDIFQANLTVNHAGIGNTYIALNSAGNQVIGDLILENNSISDNSDLYVSANAGSDLTVTGSTTVNHNGVGTTGQDIYVGNNGNIIFNGTVRMTNNGTNGYIYCNNGPSGINQYNENIEVSSLNVNNGGVSFGRSGGFGTLAATKTITIPGVDIVNFIGGDLYFRNFTQTGATNHSFELAATAAYIYNYSSNWGGNVNFIAPRIYNRQSTFNGTSYFEKTGATADNSFGANNYIGNAEFVLSNTGAAGNFTLANNQSSDCSGDLTLTHIGTIGTLTFGRAAGNYSVSGNVFMSNLSSGTNNADVYIGNNAGAIFTINGNVTIDNNSSSTLGNQRMYFGNNGVITINGNTDVTNRGSGVSQQIYIANQANITFNGTLDIHNQSTATNSIITCGNNAASSNTYNGNITLESSVVGSDGIFFGPGAGTLATGLTATIGGAGFSSGELRFRNFTQLGNTPQAITVTNTGTIFQSYDSQWNANVDFRGPRIYTRGTTYNGTLHFEKTDASNDNSAGGNVFNGVSTFNNSGTGNIVLGNTVGDDFNADANFVQTSTGLIRPTNNSESTFAGNINIDHTTNNLYFGNGANGRATFDGAADQTINDLSASNNPLFRDFSTNKSGGSVILNMPVEIISEMDLVAGNVISDATNLMIMRDNSIVSNVSDNAYVEGPIRKIGNDAFDFPVGKVGFYRPISISAPSVAADYFTAEFFDGAPDGIEGPGVVNIESPIDNISDCEYWILDRTGTSNVNVTLSYRNYGINGCSGVSDLAALSVARWDIATRTWTNNIGTATVAPTGSITTDLAITTFSPFALATSTNGNDLPIELVDFKAQVNHENKVDLSWQTASEINNEFFTIERSKDGENFEIVGKVEGAGNSTSILNYATTDLSPYNGVSYYRLKQTDFDGQFEYSMVRRVKIQNDGDITVYPNPINLNEDMLNIVSTAGNIESVTIFDNLGRKVYQSNNSSNKLAINISNFGTGVYLVNIEDGNQIISKRFVVQ